jgi:Flp pilus assembly protein TadG
MMRHRQTAATITTFALVAPVFLFIVFGTLEMARVLSAWMVITNEAVEAARYGSVHYDATRDSVTQANQVKAVIVDRLRGVLAMDGLVPAPVVRVTADPKVDVIISYQVPLVIPLVSQF